MKRSGATPRLKVSAFVKAKKMTKAILDVQFVGRDGNETHQWAAYIGAKESGDPPVTHDWKRYEGIVEIPEGTQKLIVAVQIYGPGDVWIDDIAADYTEEKATDPQASIPPAVSPVRPDSDVADVAFEERSAGNDPRKRYFLIGPSSPPSAPAAGHRLLLLLPGGDGGTGFQTFARRIAKNALPPGYLLAELVAVSWTPEQAQQIVWPTASDKLPDAGFTTEQFVEDVITDVMRLKKIDPRFVFILGWSSGGPPVYASSLGVATRITGCVRRHVGIQAGAASGDRKRQGSRLLSLSFPGRSALPVRDGGAGRRDLAVEWSDRAAHELRRGTRLARSRVRRHPRGHRLARRTPTRQLMDCL